MLSFLQRRYPFSEEQHWLKDTVLFAIIVFLLLYFLQPFGFGFYPGNKLRASLIYALITFFSVLLFALAVFGPLTRRVKPWLIWHQALCILAMIFFIGLCNFLFFTYDTGIDLHLWVFGLFFYWVLLFGVIITFVSISIDYIRLLHRRLDVLLDKNADEQEGIVIDLHDHNVRGNDLHIRINDFLYAEAQKNNVAVYHLQEGQPACTELRSTLAAILDDLRSYENIFQCHRSFIVNVNNITAAHGNSNGYQLTVGNCHTVPVSRTYVPRLRSFIS